MAGAVMHAQASPRAAGAGDGELTRQVLHGLTERPKRLSPTYLYDARGSALFELICRQPEYYLTRTELAIMQRHGSQMALRIGSGALLLELGSGASLKTRILLDRLPDLAAYVPVDISRSSLGTAARAIRESYPGLEVLPVEADFTRPFALPAVRAEAARTIVYFPGSTIGNFDAAPAVELLALARGLAGPNGALIIGIDLVKDRERLLRAYDDAAGVTAAFNLNLLARLDRELGADFDLRAFRHAAVWNAAESRIEMHLVSLLPQRVHLAGQSIDFEVGEPIVTEHCHKYTQKSFGTLAARAGWRVRAAWSDERGFFSVLYLEARGRTVRPRG
ncbi:MAG: L-histidine N(alpha)-methyltransferase, partial [Steroidobacteraceae bacterium]